MSVTIETRKTKDHLLISIPINEVSAEEIEQIISSLKTEFVLRKSEITEDEAEEISEEIKSDWWKKMTAKPKAEIKHTSEDFSISELNNKSWKSAKGIKIGHYWSGKKASKDRHFETKILWSATALYVRFEANQDEPLVVNDEPNLDGKTDKLWEKDVCEIFFAPNKDEFRRYFEFEIAPTGEWIDLGIYQKPDERITDREYNSGMKTAAKIEKDKVISAFKVEWKAFGTTPQVGDIWLGNILRSVGNEPNRGYLAWSPTLTEKPNFHVPEKFGEFEFIK